MKLNDSVTTNLPQAKEADDRISLQPIFLQTLFSSVPGVIATAMLPYALSSFNGGIELVGLAFAAIRIGSIIGGYLAAFCQRHFNYRNILSICELFAAAFVGSFLVTFKLGSYPVLLGLLFFKAIASGVVGNTRAGYLRSLGSATRNSNALIATNTLLQASYGIAGIFIIASHPDSRLALLVLAADAITSIGGAILFRWLPQTQVAPDTQVPLSVNRKSFRKLAVGLRKQFRWLFAAEILLTAGFSGTNLLLVGMGNDASHSEVAYGFMLAIYAAAFAMGGHFSTANGWTGHIGKILSRSGAAIMLICFAILMMSTSYLVNLMPIFLLFLAYAAVLNGLNRRWFRVSDQEVYPGWLAIRNTVMSLILALGEATMGLAPRNGYAIRTFFVAICALCFLVQRSKEWNASKRFIKNDSSEGVLASDKKSNFQHA